MKIGSMVIAVAALFCCHPAARSQSMLEAPMMAQTQMRMGADGRVENCGMRVFGFIDAGGQRQMFDTSLTLNRSGYGLGKITGMVGPASNNPGDLHSVEVYGGWFRKQGGKPTMPLKPYFNGEDSKSKLFIADIVPTVEVLEAISMGQPIQLSVSWREGNSIIYFGTPAIQDSQREQFSACLDDLIQVMKAGLSGAQQK